MASVMASVCFGCAGSFERPLLEEVGDQLFCRLCLGRLLHKVEERGADRGADRGVETREDRAPDRPAPISLPADPPCFVCGGPLEGDEFVRLHGFAICTGCSRAFAGEPVEEEAEEEAEEEIEEELTPVGERPAPAPDDQPRATPGTATEWCAACGRAMPGPGSYHMIEGRPHCAACAPEARRPSGACDACRREVDALTTTRGFRLCAACLENDRELALAVARARHRRRLERQGRRLLGDGEDD